MYARQKKYPYLQLSDKAVTDNTSFQHTAENAVNPSVHFRKTIINQSHKCVKLSKLLLAKI